jgi:hypothetical protein
MGPHAGKENFGKIDLPGEILKNDHNGNFSRRVTGEILEKISRRRKFSIFGRFCTSD